MKVMDKGAASECADERKRLPIGPAAFHMFHD
jgi:hypothetical protein